MHLEHGMNIGLVLMATAAGEPFVTKLGQISKCDPAYTLGLLVLLSFVTILYMPIAMPFLLPGVIVSPVAIAKPLVFLILLPLIVGLLIKAYYEKIAMFCASPLDWLSSIFVISAAVLFIIVYFDAIIATWGSRAILTALVFLWLSFAVGYFLGGPNQLTKSLLGLSTAQRGTAAALIIAVNIFPRDENAILMVIIITLMGLLTLFPYAMTVLRRKNIAAKQK